MDYRIEILEGDSEGAKVVDLMVKSVFDEIPIELWLHFGHLDFDVVWNAETHRQDTVRGVHRYFGGMGEGIAYRTWQAAILCSLYDAYQVYDEIKQGDTFTCTYNGEVARFIADGVHIVVLP